MMPAGFEAGQTRSASTVWDERARLAALESYSILDTPPERAFDEVVRLAAQICDAPFAVVNLVAAERQFFKAEIGLGVRETALDVSICAHALLRPGLFVVPDTARDARFACNPLVTGAPHLRFYAGALLETEDGLPLGTLCVLDREPRPEGLTPQQGFALQVLARQVMSQLELRRALQAREADAAANAESERQFRILADSMPQMVWATQPDGFHDYYNQRWYEFTGMPAGSTDGVGWNGMFHPEDQARAWARWRHSLATGEPYEIEYRLRRADGDYRWTLGRALAVRDRRGASSAGSAPAPISRSISDRGTAAVSEERLRLALSAAEMVGTCVWDVPATGSPPIRAMRGCSPWRRVRGGGLPIETLLPAIHPEDRARPRWRSTARGRRQDGAFEAEYRWC